jgi:hypothetical protein
MHRVLILLSFVIPYSALAQNSQTVRVGVAALENQSARSVPLDVEHDRLVRSINQLKPDKKTHLKLEAVPLEGSSGNEVVEQAAQKSCDYVVYPTLLELRQSGDPYVRRPGTMQTNPNATWGNQTPEGQAMEPQYEATVDYKLYDVKAHTTTPGPPFSARATSEIDTVAQVLDRIAMSVFGVIKKGGTPPAPMRE